MRAQRSTHGFLFADLRGYTQYVERHGDDAGAALLGRYRQLVRETVTSYGGAEIKTEGDSFYIVFPSASSAVECALAVVEAARQATEADPSRPVNVGVGIHAGETVEQEDGYVGSAVNIAARVCAQARAGEVLVTETVRALTRTGVPATFLPRGRRRLKGITEPIAVYAAEPPSGASERREVGRPFIVAVAGAVLLLAVACVAVLALRPGQPSTGQEPGGGAAATPVSIGSLPGFRPDDPPGTRARRVLPPGRYVTNDFRPRFSFNVQNGWHLEVEAPDMVMLSRGVEEFLTFHRLRVGNTGPCGTDGTEPLPAGAAALYAWVEGRERLEVTDPSPRSVDGYTGLQFDVTGAAAAAECPPYQGRGPGVDILEIEGATMYLKAQGTARFIAVDVGAETVTIIIEADPAELDSMAEAAMEVVGSVRFGD